MKKLAILFALAALTLSASAQVIYTYPPAKVTGTSYKVFPSQANQAFAASVWSPTLTGYAAAKNKDAALAYLAAITATNASQTNALVLWGAQISAFCGDSATAVSRINNQSKLNFVTKANQLLSCYDLAGDIANYYATATNTLSNPLAFQYPEWRRLLTSYATYQHAVNTSDKPLSDYIFQLLPKIAHNGDLSQFFVFVNPAYYSQGDYKAWLNQLVQNTDVSTNTVAYLGILKSKLSLLQ